MKRLVASLLLVVAFGCQTSRDAVRVDDDVVAGDCASADVQRLITFCASPQAADLARDNAELMGDSTSGDVPYSPVPVGDSPTRGPRDAPVTVVMFTDLECPYCAQMHETWASIMNERPDDVRLVFKHTPLTFHPNAVPAALGALAAREQGKFWPFVDRLYSHQDALDQESLIGHAEKLGLDLEQFQNDFGSQSHIAAVEADLGLAGQVGVEGTPTVFVNGVRVVGVYPEDALHALVDQQKALVQRLREAGVDAEDLYWRMVATQYKQSEQPTARQPEPEPPMPEDVVAYVPTDGAPTRGAAATDALVTIVEFSDFQCPYCAAAHDAIEPILAKNKAHTRFAYRHYPLPNHPQAGPAAIASLVAQEAGKFWEYHDRLFAGQNDLSEKALLDHAREVGVDPEAISTALEDEKREMRIVEDQKLGFEIGVQGTPTFFVNGIMVMGLQSPDAFQQLIDEQRELAERVRQETGLEGDELYRAVVERNREDEDDTDQAAP